MKKEIKSTTKVNKTQKLINRLTMNQHILNCLTNFFESLLLKFNSSNIWVSALNYINLSQNDILWENFKWKFKKMTKIIEFRDE